MNLSGRLTSTTKLSLSARLNPIVKLTPTVELAPTSDDCGCGPGQTAQNRAHGRTDRGITVVGWNPKFSSRDRIIPRSRAWSCGPPASDRILFEKNDEKVNLTSPPGLDRAHGHLWLQPSNRLKSSNRPSKCRIGVTLGRRIYGRAKIGGADE